MVVIIHTPVFMAAYFAAEVILVSNRALIFPDDVSIGFFEATLNSTVVASGPARGRVSVPKASTVHLDVSCPIRGLGQLRADDLTSIKLVTKNGTDADFKLLSHLTGLRELNASKSHRVSDAGLAAIAPLRRLRDLDLYAAAVTDAGLVHLAGMGELEFLNLQGTRAKGSGLAHLVGMQRLHYLALDRIGDHGIPHLLRLRGLQRLFLADSHLTAAGEARLREGLPGLRQLYAWPSRQYQFARERARDGVLEILAARLGTPGRRPFPMELRETLPAGSRIAEVRWPDGAEAVDWPLDDLDRIAAVLPKLGAGRDLRVVTPNGIDVWIPWLRPRGEDRRGAVRRRRATSVSRRARPPRVDGDLSKTHDAERIVELESEVARWRESALTDPVTGLLNERAHLADAPAGKGHAVTEIPDVLAVYDYCGQSSGNVFARDVAAALDAEAKRRQARLYRIGTAKLAAITANVPEAKALMEAFGPVLGNLTVTCVLPKQSSAEPQEMMWGSLVQFLEAHRDTFGATVRARAGVAVSARPSPEQLSLEFE